MNDADLLSAREKRRRAELDQWADQQEATPPEQKSGYLSPIGPEPPPGGMPSSGLPAKAAKAVGGGLYRGFESLAEGSRNVLEGLVKITSVTPLTNSAGGEWTTRMKAVKQTIDGLFQIGLSPVAAVTGAIGEAAGGALDQPILDPWQSEMVRSAFGGRTGDKKVDQIPMTGQEALDLVAGLLAIGAAHKVAGRGTKPAGGGTPPASGETAPAPRGPLALPGETGGQRA